MTNQNTVLIIGSGRSGRGMLGELYHKAGFHIVFADNDPSLVNGLRAVGHYSVEMTDLKSGAKEESVITDFAVLNTVADHAAYIEQLATSRWISTALMPAAFDRVMEDVAEAALLRLSRGTSEPQFITLGANFVGMETYCTQKLRTLLGEDRWNAFSQNTHLIMSIVNRKNLLPRCPDTQDPYRVEGDNKPVLRVEDLPALRNAADRPPFFRLESGLDRAMAIKIWSGNLVQCSMAFIAIQKGITGTYEASWDPDASRCAFYAAREGYRAVAAEYGLPPRSAEEEKAPVCVFRGKDFNDSLARLIRDPIRKLGKAGALHRACTMLRQTWHCAILYHQKLRPRLSVQLQGRPSKRNDPALSARKRNRRGGISLLSTGSVAARRQHRSADDRCRIS